jgi:hypothetical protein
MNLHEDARAIRLARALGAFRTAVDKLRKHYEDLESRKLRELQTHERISRVAFPYPDSYTTEDRSVKLTYTSRVHNKLIFVATTTEGTTVLVKFTRRYSTEAH